MLSIIDTAIVLSMFMLSIIDTAIVLVLTMFMLSIIDTAIVLSMFMLSIIDTAIVLTMFMLSIIFVIVCGLFELRRICSEFFLPLVYICIAVADAVINRGGLSSY